MSKIQKLIKEKYEEIINSDNGSSIYKMDLHIHTPDSLNDYNFSSQLDKNYEQLSFNDIKKYAIENEYIKSDKIDLIKKLNKKELTAVLIVKKAIRNKVNLIVIADHNTINGFKTIRYAKDDIVKPDIPFSVLPGIEITVFGGYHLIGIFNPKDEEYKSQWQEVKERLNLSIKEGNSDLATSKSLLDTIKIIKDEGGITYIPHLDKYNCTGQTWIKVLNNKKLDLIGANNKNVLPYDKIDSNNLPIITDSDAHCVEKIGESCIKIKIQYPSFEHLKMSILEKKIRFKNNRKEPKNRIIGVAIKGGFLGGTNESWQLFPFNSDLNCIIGGRGVGKSTLIQYISDLFKTHISKKKYLFLGQAKYALIYFCINEEIYCIKGELKPIKNNYTGRWNVEIGKQNKKIIDIRKEITIYKIKQNQTELQVKYVSDRKKRRKMLNSLKLESYYQTQIESIGEEHDKVNDWFERFVISRKEKFNRLKRQLKNNKKELDDKMSELFNTQNTNKIDQAKKLYKFNKEIKEEQIEIYNELIEELNSILEPRIKIKTNEKESEKNEILNYFQDIVQSSSILNYSKRNIMLKHLDYFVEIPYLDFIIMLIKERWNKIKEETGLELINNSSIPHKTINWDEEKMIKSFKEIFFNNKLYLKKYGPINIKISLDVNSYKENANSIYKPLSQLSYGQRAITILTIILEGFTILGDTSPLIIDQPEDQLDNAYISNHLVKTIRNIKGERQIILTTHNPNIPIGGDAENVFCLKSNGEFGIIDSKGAIDKSKIISFIVENMEGGKIGLEMRLKKYVTTNSVDSINIFS